MSDVLGDRVTVDGCPCGSVHLMSPAGYEGFLASTAGRPPTITATSRSGAWTVPRIYIALHGLTAWQLPRLADLYSWPASTEGNHR